MTVKVTAYYLLGKQQISAHVKRWFVVDISLFSLQKWDWFL